MTRAYGIDLGTTYSVLATVDEHGVPVVLPNALGEETTPSVVCFESPHSVLVGAAAKQAGPMSPEQTVALIKRQMGTANLLEFHGSQYSPESISALILRAVTEQVRPAGGTVPVVVTVPAYFGIREREATQEAAVLAGLEVLELVAEPLAAAIHYGLSQTRAAGNIVVYDLGGGTFDATVLRFPGTTPAQVVATDGDSELGGADWDRRLVAHLLEQYVRAAAPDDDPMDDLEFMTGLALAAEETKRALSARMSHRVSLRRGTGVVAVEVTRAEFESMTADLVDNTIGCLHRLLAAAAPLGVTTVDRCLLVGGASRMPMVAAAIAREFGWPVSVHDPDLAVAKGAAIRAYQLCAEESVWVTPDWGRDAHPGTGRARPEPRAEPRRPDGRDAQPGSVVPRSFGLLIADSHDRSGTRTFVEHVIHRNERLPVVDREAVVATILPGQATIRIEVFEQAGAVESAETEHNRRVLDGELSGLPDGLKAGAPIHVRLSLGLDGRLALTAHEPRSGATLRLDAYIDGVLDGAERTRMAAGIARLAVRQ